MLGCLILTLLQTVVSNSLPASNHKACLQTTHRVIRSASALCNRWHGSNCNYNLQAISIPAILQMEPALHHNGMAPLPPLLCASSGFNSGYSRCSIITWACGDIPVTGLDQSLNSLFLFQLIFVLIATVMPFLVVHFHYVFLVFSV